MTQQIIDVGANANDGTGEPLRQAFTAVNDNFTQIWTAGPVGSQVQITGNVVSTTVTNLGLTLAGNGIGNITANSSIVPGTASVYDLGAADNKFQYIYGDYFVGNGALLTGIGGTYSNANIAAFLPTYTGNLVSLTGPVRTTANVIAGNIITSGFLGVSGNISGGNITGTNLLSSGYVSAVGNIYGGVVNATGANISGNISILGNILTGNITTSGNIAAGTVTANSFLGGTLLTTGAVSAVGNVTAPYFIGNGALLTGLSISGGTQINYGQSNVAIASANANVVVGVNGTSNVATFSTTGLGITGGVSATTVSATGNVLGGNLNTTGKISAAGNITGNYFVGNGSLLTGITASNVSAGALIGDTLSSNVLYSSLQVVGNLVYVNAVGNITTSGRFIGSGAGLTNIPGANVTGQVSNALTAGTVTTNAQPNITSIGTLISLTATGNITGNYFIGNGALLTGISASGSNANALIGDTLSSNVLYSSLQVVANLQYLNVDGNITTSGRFIGPGTGLTNIPAANIVGAVANATYATSAGTAYSVAGANVSGAVANATYATLAGSATTANTASTATYANTANAVAGANVSGAVANATYATLAGSATTANTASTVTTAAQPNITSVGTLASVSVAGNATAGNILASGQISAIGNIAGNYFIGNGALLTGIASNASANANALVGNTLSSNVLNSTLVSVGNLNNLSVIGNTVGGNFLTAGQVSATGNITSNYFIGNGRQLTGIIATTVGTLPSLSVTGNTTTGNLFTNGIVSAVGNIKTVGNVSGNYFIGNGSLLTGITVEAGTSILNGNSNVAVNANGNVTIGVTGTSNVAVFIPAGIEVNGLVSATGNVTGNYLIGNGALITGLPAGYSNADVANYLPTYSGNLVSLTGPVTTTSNVTGGNLLTDGVVSATGNVTGDYILGNGALLTGVITSVANINNGTSNITVVSSGGNITVGVGGTSNVIQWATTGEYVTGVVSASGNVTGGNLSTGGSVSAVGNIAGNYFIGNGSQLTGVAASSVNANSLIGNTLSSNVLYSSLTQVGTLANLTVTGNVTGGNVLTGGTVSATGNILAGNIITSGPSGNITGANVISGTTLSATANVIGGNITTSGLITATGNATAGNVLTAGLVSATANVIGGNLVTAGLITASGNAIVGNILTAGQVSATANIIGGNLLTSGLISATSTITSAANITGGNLLTGGVISATGNITGGNVNTSNIRPVSGGLTISTASGNLTLQPSGNIVLANTIINSVAYPLQDTDAASKIYVDNMVSTSLSYHTPVAAATTTTLATTTGGSITYTQPNGVANGVGALLTTTGSFNLIDTANVQTIGTRILVKNEGNAVYNGVYTWANATNIIRSTDTDTYGPDSTTDLSLNDYFFVQGGNINKGGAWVVSAPNGTITFGTSNITFSQFSSSQTYTANTDAGISLSGTQINAKVDQNTTAFDGGGNIIVKAGANLTTPNIGAATGTSLSVTANVTGGNLLTSGLVSATGNIIGNYFIGNGSQLTGVAASSVNANALVGNTLSSNVLYSSLTQVGTLANASVSGNVVSGNITTAGLVSATGNITGNYILGNGSQLTGILGSNVNMGSNTAGALVSNAVTLTTSTTVTNGIALLNQVLGKLVPTSPPNFPNSTSITLSGIASYRMANITQVDNTPGANKAVSAGTTVANVLRVATYATNTISTVGPGDSGTIVAVRNGSNVGNVTLNAGANPSGNGTYGSNLVISNNYDYHTANASIAAGFWYVFSAAVSGASAPGGWNELYIADTGTANTNTTVWYYDNSSPSAPSFSSTTMTPPGSANLLYSSTIPHYTNNNNFTISFNVANISGNTYPVANTLASGASGGAFAAPATINYNASNIGSNVLNSFASASANTTASVTTGFGGSATAPTMTVNNSYSSGTLTLTTALGNIVLYKSGNTTAIDEGNVVINTSIGTGSGNAFRIVNPGTGNTPTFTGSEAAFNSQSGTLQTYDATVVGSGTSGVLKHDQTNYSTGYLPAGPNLSSGRSGTQYFTMKFVRTAVSKFDVKYTGNIAGMWVALPGSVIDSSSSANGWINMAVAYGGAGYPGVNSPGNGSDGCALGGIVTLNTSVTNSSKTCTFGTVSSSSTASNEIYVRIALVAGQSVTALTLETASN